MPSAAPFAVVAIPLNRPAIKNFLLEPSPTPAGAPVERLGQRPSPPAARRWADTLARKAASGGPISADDLLALDDPRSHLTRSFTDRLVPVHLLHDDPDYLSRNMGGWAPIFFGLLRWRPADAAADPLLRQLQILESYGETITFTGADPAQVAGRLAAETGRRPAELAAEICWLFEARQRTLAGAETAALSGWIRRLFNELGGGGRFQSSFGRPLADHLLYDELLDAFVRLALRRRAAAAAQDDKGLEEIAAAQETLGRELAVTFILKGEYIMGRHRRSTVLIARELGLVIKQPGPEPHHVAELAARTHEGLPENWPRLTGDRSIVTARGRVRLTLEEKLIPRLHAICRHPLGSSTLFGLHVEPYVAGATLQEKGLAEPGFLDETVYEQIIRHQLICEAIGVDNADWHSANFIVPAAGEELVHIDWGAAMPLDQGARTAAGAEQRLNQVENIAFSFHDEGLARKIRAFHAALLADPARLARLRREAAALAAP